MTFRESLQKYWYIYAAATVAIVVTILNWNKWFGNDASRGIYCVPPLVPNGAGGCSRPKTSLGEEELPTSNLRTQSPEIVGSRHDSPPTPIGKGKLTDELTGARHDSPPTPIKKGKSATETDKGDPIVSDLKTAPEKDKGIPLNQLELQEFLPPTSQAEADAIAQSVCDAQRKFQTLSNASRVIAGDRTLNTPEYFRTQFEAVISNQTIREADMTLIGLSTLRDAYKNYKSQLINILHRANYGVDEVNCRAIVNAAPVLAQSSFTVSRPAPRGDAPTGGEVTP